MSENNDKPIPSPFMNQFPVIDQRCIDEVGEVIKKYGYNNFFITVHKKTIDGSCEVCGGSSFKSECLLRFLKNVVETIENDLDDVENKG